VLEVSFAARWPVSDLPREQLHMQGVDPLQGQRFWVCKRDGRVEEFNEARILLALESAFKAHRGLGLAQALPDALQAEVKRCADRVGEQLQVERIQDAAEEQLMAEGYHEVARRYILYREDRRRARVEREARGKTPQPVKVGRAAPVAPLSPSAQEKMQADRVLAKKQLGDIYEQAIPRSCAGAKLEESHRRQFQGYLNEGDYLRALDAELLEFDVERLARSLRPERDGLFTSGGVKALAERYLTGREGRCIDTPQYFWMKVAMGLALPEKVALEGRALEFYETLSSFRFIPSDAIMRYAGTPQRQSVARNEEEDEPCAWLELWRNDIWGFLARAGEARQNKGLWVPDLFMQRVREHGPWTLFDPGEMENLRHGCADEFEARYLEREQAVALGRTRSSRRVNARDLWREILTSLQLTGQPWLRFQDVVRLRSAPEYAGGFGTGADKFGVSCPLGAINLAAHLLDGGLNLALLQNTVASAVRMLDNAVDLSASSTGLEGRPIGLGVAGFAEALEFLGLDENTVAGADFADESMELVSYFAILASAQLAAERGCYATYADSKWSRGVLPLDSLALLSKQRKRPWQVRGLGSRDWEPVRARVQEQGMRNSATTAVTALRRPCAVAGLLPATGTGDPHWLVECAARRQKWIDLEHTLDLPLPEKHLGRISHLYMEAWEKGLKSTRQLILISPAPGAGRAEGGPRLEPAPVAKTCAQDFLRER
jgi:ribonucleotide reductase alpha subunit